MPIQPVTTASFQASAAPTISIDQHSYPFSWMNKITDIINSNSPLQGNSRPRIRVFFTSKLPELGHYCGYGGSNSIYQDKNDSTVLWQFYSAKHSQSNKLTILKAVYEFKEYYGDDAAVLYQYHKQFIMKMKKIPGVPLDTIPTSSINRDVMQALHQFYLTCLARHYFPFDVQAKDVLYDIGANQLNPISYNHLYPFFPDQLDQDKQQQLIVAAKHSSPTLVQALINKITPSTLNTLTHFSNLARSDSLTR